MEFNLTIKKFKPGRLTHPVQPIKFEGILTVTLRGFRTREASKRMEEECEKFGGEPNGVIANTTSGIIPRHCFIIEVLCEGEIVTNYTQDMIDKLNAEIKKWGHAYWCSHYSLHIQGFKEGSKVHPIAKVFLASHQQERLRRFIDTFQRIKSAEMESEVKRYWEIVKNKVFTPERGEHQFGYGEDIYGEVFERYRIPFFKRTTSRGNPRWIVPSLQQSANGTLILLPPESRKGFWIGRKGSTIKALQKKTGRRLVVK